MSRYDSSSHVYYRCQYHIVWTPKYRLKILKSNIAKELYKSIYIYSHMKNCKVVELNVQIDHVDLVVRLPPSLSISGYMGFVKGRTAIRLFNKFPYLRKKKLWGNHFWQRGYFVDSVGESPKIGLTECPVLVDLYSAKIEPAFMRFDVRNIRYPSRVGR